MRKYRAAVWHGAAGRRNDMVLCHSTAPRCDAAARQYGAVL
jgi:hypothetical protein